VLTISDTGTGISPDDIEKIFEPFYTKKKMGRSGTGLGMAVVWGTIKDHNGYIDVQSTEGKARPPRLSVSDPPALQARALRAGGGQASRRGGRDSGQWSDPLYRFQPKADIGNIDTLGFRSNRFDVGC